jgi:rhodanese-related sulfurtransferase
VSSPPTTFTFGGYGADTAYAWVTDAYGNISASASATVTVTPGPATNVYYSVGQSSSNLMTGSPTVTIASGTATFSQAQTGNIGVGDQVTYNTSAIAYISGKISQTQWSLVTATGTTPANISSSTVVSIKRAFTSLSNAVTNMTGASYLNNTSLVAANVIVNLPCYYDSGPDTTSVTIPSSTITASSTYLNIFTPNNTSTQANQSQRYSGVWNANAYNLVVTNGGGIVIDASYVRIVGLQIDLVATTSNHRGIDMEQLPAGVTTSTSYIVIDSNIVRAQIASTSLNNLGIGNGSANNGASTVTA